jgi:hypothetical protein
VQTGTYVKTHVLTVFFVPVFCLGAYRVKDAPSIAGWFSWRDGWYLLERIPLSRFAIFWNGAMTALLAVGAMSILLRQ